MRSYVNAEYGNTSQSFTVQRRNEQPKRTSTRLHRTYVYISEDQPDDSIGLVFTLPLKRE